MTARALPRWALAAAGVAAVVFLLVSTVSIGLRLRSASGLGPLPRSALLDYAAPGGSFSPLSRSFIEGVLGGAIDDPGTVAVSGGGSPAAFARSVPVADFPKRVSIAHPLTNDDRADAFPVSSVPFTARTDTRKATREPDESAACGQLRGGSVWYRYTPPSDVGLIANTFGTNYSTTLGAFAGGTNVRCDTDVRGNAIVQFVARKGVTYFFQVAGPAGGGQLVFNLDPEGVTTLESKNAKGDRGDASSAAPSISGDGRLVAFESSAENLVKEDTNGVGDVYVRDRVRRTISLVSVSSSGTQGNDKSYGAFVSGNGRFVAFESFASNLVKGDTNGVVDVFVRDLVTHRTERVSVSSSGAQQPTTDAGAPGGNSAICFIPSLCSTYVRMFPTLSYDGRYVAFQSDAPNLVPNDDNQSSDVFVHNRVTRRTERVSVDSSGREREPDGSTVYIVGASPGCTPTPASRCPYSAMTPSISGNGRFVLFETLAGNLVAGDNNESTDVFVHDRLERTTERIAGAPGPANVDDQDQPYYAQNELAQRQALSFDGRYVAFSAAPRNTAGPFEGHIFVHDRKFRRTVQVDVSSSGVRAEDNAVARSPAISPDGRYVAFSSQASNLVAGDDNGSVDVFLRDLMTGATIRLTGAPVPRGDPCEDCGSSLPAISADGRVVAFQSNTFNNAFVPPVRDDQQVFVNERPDTRR
jgi:Tol biopolymer transport system component